MPYNNKNKSFQPGRKKKRGGGGNGNGRNRKRNDSSNNREPEEAKAATTAELNDSDNGDVDQTSADQRPQDLDNSDVSQSCDTKVTVAESELVPIVIDPEEVSDNGGGVNEGSETIDSQQIIVDVPAANGVVGDDADDDGKSVSPVEECISQVDNSAASGVELVLELPRISGDTPIKLIDNQCEIPLQTVTNSDCNLTPPVDDKPQEQPPLPTLIESVKGICGPASEELDKENCVGTTNQWSIESILFNNNSADKPIERSNDTVDEQQGLSSSNAVVADQNTATQENKQGEPINYGPTGLQIEERATDWNAIEGSNNCAVGESIILVEPAPSMGAEVDTNNSNKSSSGGDHSSDHQHGPPLSKSSSFSSNSSANTLSTIIFAGAAGGEGETTTFGGGDQSMEWDESLVMDSAPKSLRELALTYLNSLPYGHSIIEELAVVSERLKDLVLQTGTMDNIATALRTMPEAVKATPEAVKVSPPVPPPVPPRKPKIAPKPVLTEIKLANNTDDQERPKSRLLSIIRDSSKSDITSGSDDDDHKAHPKPLLSSSATHRLIGSDCNNNVDRSGINHVGNVGPNLARLLENRPPKVLLNGGSGEGPAVHVGGVTEETQKSVTGTPLLLEKPTGLDNADHHQDPLRAEMKEKLFINGDDQGDQKQRTIFKNTSTRDEVTNNNCKSEDSHPLNELAREFSSSASSSSSGGGTFGVAQSYSFASSVTENLHHNHVIRPLSKEDKFCRGLARSGSFKAPTLYEEEETPTGEFNVNPSAVHSRLQQQLSDMHKKRSSFIEEVSAQQQRLSSDKNAATIDPPPRRRSSLPYELHERQLAYLEELEKKIEQQQFRPRHSGSGVFGSRVLQEQLSEAEAFRKQMHDEWRARIAERDERRFSKVIKLTPIIPEVGVVTANGGDAHKPMFENSMEEEFLTRVQERRQKLHLPSDSDWESGAESTPKDVKPPKVFNIPITVIEGDEKVTEVKRLPKHLQEFAESLVAVEAACQSSPAVAAKSSSMVEARGPVEASSVGESFVRVRLQQSVQICCLPPASLPNLRSL